MTEKTKTKRKSTPKARGTNEVLLELNLGSKESLTHLSKNFGARARKIGTMPLLDIDSHVAGPHDISVTIRYKHVCANKGNAKSDALRFLHNAMKRPNGSMYRHTISLARIVSWKPLVA